jgi:tetratricopeptide (TPR) repeat protein
LLLALTLTCGPLDAFPDPQNRQDAVTGLKHDAEERRAEAVIWLARHGGTADEPLLVARLRDESRIVRMLAEQGLWVLWSRSGDPAVDQLMERGGELMQEGRFTEAIAGFGEVIRRKPDFAEGWNKRATAYFLAGDFKRSLADCDEVMKRNPNHFGALSGYGQIYFKLEQYDKAIEYWRKALAVNPNMDGVQQNIEGVEALLREKKGRTI